MTSDQFKDVELAFERALELEGARREAFLEALDRDRPAIAEKVRDLLRADASDQDTFADRVAASAKVLADESKDPLVGRLIGGWRILRRIGSGGMGAVFLAERADNEYSHEAALKIMGAQLLDENAAVRFRAERQILANLNHPNIARLIDGGSTDEGLPFLVMEYVEGMRIDKFCDSNNLNIRERLKLFQKLCAAVDYAHRNLVVHRDLKPGNLLIKEDGEPKLLDFGIAKLLEPGSYELTLARTGEGARVMTPEYASPEQVRGEAVSVATDIYALGVLLYRLLTGHSPYGPSATTQRELESAILEAEPKKPSASVSEYTSGSASPSDATIRYQIATPERWRKNLVGDLDNIVMKCLQKDPERRYATARELRADIDRYLSDRPVLARGDSWTYKIRKFLIRNARLTAATVLVLSTIVGLIGFYTLRLADERDKAMLAAAESEQVAQFLTNIFRNADPHTAKGEPATAIDLLNSAEGMISDLDDQPILQARLAQIIGDTYANLGESKRSVSLLEWSLQARRSDLENDPIAYGALLEDLAEAYRLSDRLGAAERAMRDCIKQYERRLPADHPKILYYYGRLAVILSDQNRKSEAIELLQNKLKQRLRQNPQHDRASIDMYGNTAHMLVDLGRFDEANKVHPDVVRISKEIDGPLHPNALIRIKNFALMRLHEYRFVDAVRIYDEAIAGAEQVWPETHPQVPRWTAERALAKAFLGKFDEAFAEFEAATERLRNNPGESSGLYLGRRSYYAKSLAMAGRFDDASAILEDAIALSFADEDTRSSLTNVLRTDLAAVRNLQGRPDEALALIDLASQNLDWLSALRASSLDMTRAQTISLLGRNDEASALYENAIANRAAMFGADGAAMIELYTEAAAHYRRSGDAKLALEHARRAHKIGQSSFPESNWLAAIATAEYAYSLAASGAPEQARPLAARARADIAAAFGPEDYRARRLTEFLEK